VSGQPMLKSNIGKFSGICGIYGPLPPTLKATTLIFNTNIAHRKIPRKFGVSGSATNTCLWRMDRQTDRRLCHSKDRQCS